MSVYDQSEDRVRFDWGQKGVEELAPISDIVVIVDVLSFSTCVDVAVSRGAVVFPFGWKDKSAEEYARAINALLARGRGQGGLSLSPLSLANLPDESRVVLPSPNGSTLTLVASSHSITLAGCLRNRGAIADHVNAHGGTVTVIGCGERWPADSSLRPALEDQIGAGAIIRKLHGSKSPEARSAEAVFSSAEDTLLETLNTCGSGRELIEKGYAEDVACSGQLDASQSVPLLADDAFLDHGGAS